MITDILTILWKEIRELLHQRGRFKGGWMGLLVFIGVFGIFMPLQSGRAWVESPVSLVYWVWVPYLMVSSVVADSFAGERERHTLETLLATRLSDRAILFGKLLSALAYGWGLTIFCVILSLVSVNIAYGSQGLLFYPLPVMVGIIILSFLVAGLAAGLGVLVSLRASTVRQAQQMFSVAFLILFIPLLSFQFLPDEWKMRLAALATQVSVEQVVWVASGILLVLNVGLILASLARFQRAKLILD